VTDLRQAAIDVLSSFTGYPDLPNGRPCGVWAYMVANGASPVTFAQRADGRVRRLRPSESAARGEATHVIDVPWLDPGSPNAKRLYYAAIETNPAGVMVMTLPKGTQDVLARRSGVSTRIELGQKRQLVELLRELHAEPDLRAFDVIGDASMRREAELERLHVLAIEALLTAGYIVDVESTFAAAARETKEEHGFDFERERSKVIRMDTFVESAYSKRRLSKPIEHYVYAARVSDFDETLPRVSEITEDKDPGREGGTYVERGVFRTLPQMWRRAHELHDAIRSQPRRWAVEREVNATTSRLEMLDRIERALVESLGAQGIVTHSETDAARFATARQTHGHTAQTVAPRAGRARPLMSRPMREPRSVRRGRAPTVKGSPLTCDVLAIGAGAAGLYAALSAAGAGASVVLVSATTLAETATYWAQGGIAAALATEDSTDRHLADTEAAGRDAVRRSAAEVLVTDAPTSVADLERLGVQFDLDPDGAFALGLEGGHSRRRVAHAQGSATGRQIVSQLSAAVLDEQRIEVLEGARAASAWMCDGRCEGMLLEDGRAIRARATILATGGAAALWSRTTNPPGSLGNGMYIAHGAGAALADLEFLQFHPTAVSGVPGREGFLVTEAIRGEGATLHGPDGERFVDELAPRDDVARTIAALMTQTGASSVALDMRAVDPARFPNVVAALAGVGLDPTRETIPVAPAAHYMMGGVATDLFGRSTVPGLYAIGEAACTGLHGANRLASNSLSECLVFGARAAAAGLDEPSPRAPRAQRPTCAAIAPPQPATREALWRHAGIVRTGDGLARLLHDPHPLARLIAMCALRREESRGAHQRADYPGLDRGLDHHHAIVYADRAPELALWR
jgi:L-aspartate oxidase